MSNSLEQLVARARRASPSDRIELRDSIAAHGSDAIDAMAEWLADPVLTRFAVRVIGKVADLGRRDEAVIALRQGREEATPDQRLDIDAELARLGDRSSRRASLREPRKRRADPGVPGWMMRTDRNNTEWLWSEVESGRLRQGWGYQPKQDLTLLRHRREQGESMDRDDDWAWPNRRMLSDEPDGMQIGDLVFTPHLPRPWTWSVLRITGSYRYDIDLQHLDYGHILPVEILEAGVPDADLTPALQAVRRYPARLRRLTREAYDDLLTIFGP